MHARPGSPSLPETYVRRRKAHTKSRKGCANCKMRHTKVFVAFNLLFFIVYRASVGEVRSCRARPLMTCAVRRGQAKLQEVPELPSLVQLRSSAHQYGRGYPPAVDWKMVPSRCVDGSVPSNHNPWRPERFIDGRPHLPRGGPFR